MAGNRFFQKKNVESVRRFCLMSAPKVLVILHGAASEMSRRVPAHALLIAEGLSVVLGGAEIFSRVSLHVRQGEILFITGASGTHEPDVSEFHSRTHFCLVF
jgi:hypothetical protein